MAKRRIEFTEDMDNYIRENIHQSTKSIAKGLGLSECTVWYRIKALGIIKPNLKKRIMRPLNMSIPRKIKNDEVIWQKGEKHNYDIRHENKVIYITNKTTTDQKFELCIQVKFPEYKIKDLRQFKWITR